MVTHGRKEREMEGTNKDIPLQLRLGNVVQLNVVQLGQVNLVLQCQLGRVGAVPGVDCLCAGNLVAVDGRRRFATRDLGNCGQKSRVELEERWEGVAHMQTVSTLRTHQTVDKLLDRFLRKGAAQRGKLLLLAVEGGERGEAKATNVKGLLQAGWNRLGSVLGSIFRVENALAPFSFPHTSLVTHASTNDGPRWCFICDSTCLFCLLLPLHDTTKLFAAQALEFPRISDLSGGTKRVCLG